MTTTVTVKTHAGQRAEIETIDNVGAASETRGKQKVEPETQVDVYVYPGREVRVREMPGE